jgi:hypothetical protein
MIRIFIVGHLEVSETVVIEYPSVFKTEIIVGRNP